MTPIKHEEFEGIRVTPNLYTTLNEIDTFSQALDDVLAKGITAYLRRSQLVFELDLSACRLRASPKVLVDSFGRRKLRSRALLTN